MTNKELAASLEKQLITPSTLDTLGTLSTLNTPSTLGTLGTLDTYNFKLITCYKRNTSIYF